MAAHRLPGRRALAADNHRLNAENNQLACKVVELTAQLDQASIDYSGALEDHRQARADAKRARAEAATAARLLNAARAQLANRDAVTVAEWVRPIDDESDRATQPTPLHERGAA